MPFVDQVPRQYTKTGVGALSKDQFGVYGITNKDGAMIYVGMGDIRRRLLDHLNGDNPCIPSYGPTHFLAGVTENAEKREKELIREYDPPCNKQIG